jgi:hypothetical protein
MYDEKNVEGRSISAHSPTINRVIFWVAVVTVVFMFIFPNVIFSFYEFWFPLPA